ncbi:MAG: CCA tRNA nucleotidyltransferase [Rhodospirillales bacterium]|nr:CCA tRNA nucleotidyltransferase [Rhodospirillales bacterium]
MTAAGKPPEGQIAPQPWMRAPETQAVMAALMAEGDEARFVGGCVRDSILKRAVKDIDIATRRPPDAVMALLERAGIRAIPTGIEHGTVTAVIGKAHFEITTLRHDVETDGRRARVAFTDDWEADALRRDFTINALSMTQDGFIHDPCEGLADLGRGVVRFVGDPVQRIEEDVLRLLRFFRFYAHYGAPPPHVESLAACRKLAHLLPRLSGERVRGELIRILLAPDPAGVLLLMQGERVLPHILPEAKEFGRLRQMAWFEDRGIKQEGLTPDALRRLASLIETDADGAAAIAQRLRLSNEQTERLARLAKPGARPDPTLDSRARRRLLYHLGAPTLRDRALIEWAARRTVDPRAPDAAQGPWLDLLADIRAWQAPEPPLKGRDVLALGVPPGPQVGALLDAALAWWEEGDFQADRGAALDYLRQLASNSNI